MRPAEHLRTYPHPRCGVNQAVNLTGVQLRLSNTTPAVQTHVPNQLRTPPFGLTGLTMAAGSAFFPALTVPVSSRWGAYAALAPIAVVLAVPCVLPSAYCLAECGRGGAPIPCGHIHNRVRRSKR